MTTIDINAVKKKLTKARISLLTKQPFWGTLALRLQLVEMPDSMKASFILRGMTPTLAVDGKKIYYAPEFVDELSHQDTMTVIAHEVSHCVFEHIGRRGDRNADKWNKAGDYVINLALTAAGFTFEHKIGWLCDSQFKDMTADQVYKLLPDDPGQAMCDILDGEVKTDKTLQDDWKIATAQAAAVAHQAGKLPAEMQRFIEDLMNPKTDWRTQLRRFVTEQSKNDYSWQRPNKKMLGAHGVYLPSLYSEHMGEIVLAIDTSGSITQEMLNLFASELNAIRAAVNPRKTTVIYCDARINKVSEFAQEDLLELELVGGGGTDFRPPFAHVEEEGITPAAFLYMTDGYGPFPGLPAPFPTMWCMTTNVEPPWGERVQLDMEA